MFLFLTTQNIFSHETNVYQSFIDKQFINDKQIKYKI